MSCLAILNSAPTGTIQAQPQSDAPRISRSEVDAYRATHEPVWLEKAPAGQGRLFYSEETWPAVIERIQGLEGQGAKWREAFFDTADKIVAAPILSYDENYKPEDIKQEWQRSVGDDLCSLSIAVKLSDDPKYRDKLREVVLTACHYPSWGQYNNDLAAGHVTSGLAMAYDWHRGLFSEEELTFIRETIRARVPSIMKALLGGMYWYNTYTWNHNQISVAGMGLAGLAFLNEIPEAGDWLAGALLNYEKVGEYSPEDGSSCEGIGYWTYGRSFILKFIEGTKDVTLSGSLYEKPFLRNAISLRLGSSTPGYYLVLKWADGQGYDFRGAHQILYRLASQYRDGQGQYLADHLPYMPNHGPTAEAFGWTVLWYDPTVTPVPPDFLDYFAPHWEVITSRSGWGEGDYMLSIKAGLNNDAHTHLDAGALGFIMGKRWLLSTSGYGLGDGQKGFWDRLGGRWKFFSNSTESQSTLLINGENQRFLPYNEAGGHIDVYLDSPLGLWAEVDLNNAYEGVENVRRTVFHRRDQYVLVLDQIDAETPVSVEWLAQVDPYAHIQLEEGVLTSADVAGSLRMRMLNDAMPFSKREPTRIYDLRAPRLIDTYAARAEGQELRLAALLQPAFSGETGSPIKASLQNRENGMQLDLSQEAWTDRVFQSHKSGQHEAASVQARALSCVIGQKSGAPEIIVATRATHLSFAAITLEAAQAFEVIVNAAPGDTWWLNLRADNAKLTLPDGLNVYTPKGEAVAASLSGGCYVIASSPEEVLRVRKWMQGVVETSRPVRPQP